MSNANTNKTKKSSSNFKLSPLNPCVAGIDIGAASIFTCAGFFDGRQEMQEHLTFTEDLKKMARWLKECGIKNVAMESTGVYWIPVYDILAQKGFDVVLVNAYYLKTVLGKKTDIKDCQWIQQLHAYGLLHGSVRPDNEDVELRGYIRQRSRRVELASQQVLLMHKGLIQMNLQLNHVISDITGTTRMSIIRSIVEGERDPKILAQYRNPRCKKSKEELAKALEGNYRDEHLLAIKQALESYDLFNKQVNECDQAIEEILKRWGDQKTTLKESTPKYTRMLSSFSYSGIIQGIVSKSFKERAAVFFINSAMTSIIGKMKFAMRYGISNHHAAALSIARRHYRFSEAPSKSFMKMCYKNCHVTCPLPVRKKGEHVWQFWKKVERKLQTVLAELSRAHRSPCPH